MLTLFYSLSIQMDHKFSLGSGLDVSPRLGLQAFFFWVKLALFFFFFFCGVIGAIGFVLCFLWVPSWQASSWLGWVGVLGLYSVVYIYLFIFNLVFIYIYIYILVIGNIMNKSLFMLVKIAKNLLLFGETTTILFI